MPVSDKYTCSCGKPCGTWPAWQSHMASAHGMLVKKGDSPETVKATTSTVTTVTKPITKPVVSDVSDQPIAIEQSVVTTPTETVITVKPTVEITDPFLSTRVVPPHIGLGVGESAKPSVTSEKPSLTPEQPSVTSERPATVSEQSTVMPEQPAVEPQKKTATATVGATTASGTPLQVQLPPMHFHIPTAPAEGRGDQPQQPHSVGLSRQELNLKG